MTIRWNDILEAAIIGKLVDELTSNAFRLEISDQDGDGLFVYAAADGGEKPENGYEYWVRLVPGNGADVIVDYTTNLETTIKPVQDFAAAFRE